jgi:DNA-binding LacI/PurR family transcriptional regulator
LRLLTSAGNKEASTITLPAGARFQSIDAQELGYQPSMAGRTLRLGRTHVAALIIPDVSNPVFAAVLLGAEQAARLRDYTVVQVSTGNDPDWQLGIF